MLDAKKLLDQFLGSKGASGSKLPGGSGFPGAGSSGGYAEKALQMAKDNPMAAASLAAVLLGSGSGKKMLGSAVKIGGLAAIAGLAYKAYQDHQSGQKPVATKAPPELLPPPADTGFHPSQAPQGEDEFALMLIRAMVAAAKADGHIDETERARIGERLKLSGVDHEAEAFLMGELERPVDLDKLVAAARTEEQRVELYTASRLAIEPESRAERGYLDMLAGRLKLEDGLVDHIEATVASATR